MPTSFGSLQAENPVLVVNLDTINRNLKGLGKKIELAAKAGMLEGAEPIRRDAQSLAYDKISGMKRKKTSNWDFQRDGATIHEVYIAPVERGVKSKTDRSRRRGAGTGPPSFVDLMFGKSYDPAFEKGKPGVVAFVDKWLGTVSAEFNTSSRVF